MVRLLSSKEEAIPQLKEGYYIRVGQTYFEIIASEMLGGFILPLASRAAPLAVGATSDFSKFSDIEPRDSKDKSGPLEFYNIAVGVRGPGKVHIKQPAGQVLLGSDENPDLGFINRRISPYIDPRVSMWVEAYSVPQFALENDYNVAIWAWVFVNGMKYAVREVCQGDTLEALRNRMIPSEPIRFGGIPVDGGAF